MQQNMIMWYHSIVFGQSPFNFELAWAQEASGGHTHCQGGGGRGGWRVCVCRWGLRGRLSRVGT